MESQPQNPEFRNNPENFHPCIYNMKQCSVVPYINLTNQAPGVQTVLAAGIISSQTYNWKNLIDLLWNHEAHSLYI